ncbi:MAG: LD-carboxypeptidase [Butyrivibrio sp.]|uniref:S66 family peptidase n=1 Tax=Butyrivibrio sp. TaxID=28121 RepID=UPI001B1E853C|nr:S66 peptidase family protein [Butyrivibrio sp.]MBO6240835.1 LD-carboxypeptidase [Butyrivibrio sp.]
MIKKPNSIKPGNTIGITAPSFGAATEPYSVLIDIAIKNLQDRGYKILEGKTSRMGDGKGISTDPMVTSAELMQFYKDDSIDAIISAGGGELMNETITHVDFDELRNCKPKWFIGYSDNTNFIFPLVTISRTMGIYGPCINGYGKNWEDTEKDAFALLEGTKTEFKGYDMYAYNDEPSDPEEAIDYDKLMNYNLNMKKVLKSFDCSSMRAVQVDESVNLSCKGILLGGCLDILTNICGTRFDRVKGFKEEYKDIIWVMEACDLSVMAYRRALWNLREAGWFDGAKGFIIGRARGARGGEFTGVNEYNAVTDMLECFGAPIIMDADIGHISPMLPVVMGAEATVSAMGNDLSLIYTSL